MAASTVTGSDVTLSGVAFADFADAARERGFQETLERCWAADAVVPEHRHPFSVEALVVQGEMWLTAAAGTQHLLAGDRFTLDREIPHSERYGAEGATVWAARRYVQEAAGSPVTLNR